MPPRIDKGLEYVHMILIFGRCCCSCFSCDVLPFEPTWRTSDLGQMCLKARGRRHPLLLRLRHHVAEGDTSHSGLFAIFTNWHVKATNSIRLRSNLILDLARVKQFQAGTRLAGTRLAGTRLGLGSPKVLLEVT